MRDSIVYRASNTNTNTLTCESYCVYQPMFIQVKIWLPHQATETHQDSIKRYMCSQNISVNENNDNQVSLTCMAIIDYQERLGLKLTSFRTDEFVIEEVLVRVFYKNILKLFAQHIDSLFKNEYTNHHTLINDVITEYWSPGNLIDGDEITINPETTISTTTTKKTFSGVVDTITYVPFFETPKKNTELINPFTPNELFKPMKRL